MSVNEQIAKSSGKGASGASRMSGSLMHLWFLPGLLATTMALGGNERFVPEWSASCKYGAIPFELHFKSRSGDPTEDDQVVSIRWGNKSSVTLPVKEALYVPGRFTTDSVNQCKSIGAFKWGQGRLLLLLPRDDRPSEDRITAVVIDSATGSFVEDGGDIGPFGDEVDLLSDSRGYRALLLRKWYQDPNTYGEFGGPDWMRIFDLNGHIHHTWDVVRP